MRIKLLVASLTFAFGLCGMENKITVIPINPEKYPHLFFEELDERIVSQVEGAQSACNNSNSEKMHTHLTNLSALLRTAQLHHKYLVDGYPHKGPLAQNAKRKNTFLVDTDTSYFYTQEFREHTHRLLELIKPNLEDPISQEEWTLMQQLFKAFIPVNSVKKTKVAQDN